MHNSKGNEANVQVRKINVVLVPVVSLGLGYLLFPVVSRLVTRAILLQAGRSAEISLLRNEHGAIVETHLGPMFIVLSLLITLIAVTAIVYYLSELLVLAERVVAYEEADKLACDDVE